MKTYERDGPAGLSSSVRSLQSIILILLIFRVNGCVEPARTMGPASTTAAWTCTARPWQTCGHLERWSDRRAEMSHLLDGERETQPRERTNK